MRYTEINLSNALLSTCDICYKTECDFIRETGEVGKFWNDTVLDCFAGSATTLKVAEQLNRKGIGIDLGYHEISKRRTSKIQKEMFI